MPVNKLEPFFDQDKLKSVREDHLNPLIDYTKLHLTPRVTAVETDAKQSFRSVVFNEAAKTITFRDGYNANISSVDLTNIIPDEFLGLTVSDDAGGSYTEIKSIRIDDATITKAPNSSEAIVELKWESQVKQYQDRPMVQKGADAPVELKSIKFDGNLANINVVGNDATITVPENPVEITAQVGNTVDTTPIHKIHISGNTTGTTVSGDTLEIILPDIPSPQAFTQWFVGFYNNLGELEADSTVTPVEGKSFAFIKDKTVVGGQFYDAWMYIGGSWTEAPVDPAITYEQPGVAGKQGVFSIKPSSHIKIDKLGQLDLDGLMSGHFVGFYPDMATLNSAVPTPVVDRTVAFVKNTGNDTWLFVKYSSHPTTGISSWETFGPQASIGLVEEDSSSAGSFHITKPIYGIKKTDNIVVGAGGVLEIKDGGGTGNILIDAEILDYKGDKNGGKFDKIKYVNGMSYAVVDSSTHTLTLEHPQRVINYTSTFEENHNQQNYKGNIFYDDTSNCWMGWATPAAPGAVSKKWTRIAHEGMSDQVKRLVKDLPQKLENVTPGNLGDNRQWEHTGWTYVASASDVGFSADYKDKGVYIQTYVRTIPGERPDAVPSKRIQLGFIDDDESGIFSRVQRDGGSSSDPFWGNWFKLGVTEKDLDAHRNDPGGHRNTIKFHRVVSFHAKYSDLVGQTQGGSSGGLMAGNVSLVADNYGHASPDPAKAMWDVPYNGDFHISGAIAFSGYRDTTQHTGVPTGRWQILLRKKKKTSDTWITIGQFAYNHTDEQKRYPNLHFSIPTVKVDTDEQIITNITFSEASNLIGRHPDLHFAPLRSHFILEDSGTRAGTGIANTFSNYFSDTDRTGDVNIRVHRANYADGTNIRIYGEHLDRTSIEMQKVT